MSYYEMERDDRIIKALEKIAEQLERLNEQPTADVEEVKHGKWREGAFLKVGGLMKYPSVICSNCGITFCDIINNHDYMYRYCPNCGARMDGDKNEIFQDNVQKHW